MSSPLPDRFAGCWTWTGLNRHFPWRSYMERHAFHALNTCAMVHFDMDGGEEDDRHSKELASRMGFRCAMANEYGVQPWVMIFNRHLAGTDDAWWRENLVEFKPWHEKWIRSVVDACGPYVMGYQLILEPHASMQEFMAEALNVLRRAHPGCKVAFHQALEDRFPIPAGYDLYHDRHFLDTDHSPIRRARKPSDQVQFIHSEGVRRLRGLFLASAVALRGRTYGLPGWKGKMPVANWDYPEVWRALSRWLGKKPPPAVKIRSPVRRAIRRAVDSAVAQRDELLEQHLVNALVASYNLGRGGVEEEPVIERRVRKRLLGLAEDD